MTSYASHQSLSQLGLVNWEIKSVNHRYLEVFFKMPESVRALELDLREILKKDIYRGKVDCTLTIENTIEQRSTLKLNTSLLNNLSTLCESVKNHFKLNETTVSPLEVLKWPGIIVNENDVDNAKTIEEIKLGFEHALQKMLESRLQEGKKLFTFISEHLEEILNCLTEIKHRIPQSLKFNREKLLQKVQELQCRVQEDRFEQEIVYLTQKIDINEELERLMIHVEAAQEALGKNEPKGRRLDFIMQEMNREVNTMSAKAIDITILQKTTDLKVLIEKIREQIQNIE